MFEDEKQKQPETGPEIFESDPTQIEESFFSFSRNYAMITDRKRDDDVVEETLDPSEAFAKFAQTELDTSNHDFTGTTSSMLNLQNTTFVKQPSYCEPPSERYKRIRQELKELQKDLAAWQKADPKSGANILGKGADCLVAKMESLNACEKYAPILNLNFSLKEGEVQTRGACSVLRDEIMKIEAEKKVQECTPEMKGVSYEFYGIGEQSERTSEIVTIDKRLAALEATIGNSRLEMMPDIRTGVLFLSRKMEGLDKDKMKNAEKRMIGLSREMKNLEKDKNKLAGAKTSDYQRKISELYGMMGRWDQSAQQLPIIAARLQSIKDMADTGRGSKGQLKALRSGKTQNENLMRENVELLATTRKNFQTSLGQMKSMCDLEKNFADLTKKMQKVR